jgi:hypothetical protein
MYPAIIDKALFLRVQDRLKSNKYFSGSNSAREPYLLTGKAYCGHCGTRLVGDSGIAKPATSIIIMPAASASGGKAAQNSMKKGFP